MSKRDRLVERVREFLTTKGLSQADLAEKADLSPTAVSRLLSGEREFRPEHAFAFATALGVTVTELLAGTEHEGLLGEWVPRDRFAESEARRTEQARELDSLRTENRALLARNASLERGLRESTTQLMGMTAEVQASRVHKQLADERGTRLAELTQQNHQLAADLEARSAANMALLDDSTRSRALVEQNYQAWKAANDRAMFLEGECLRMKGDKWIAGIVGVLGTAAVAAIASTAADDESPPPRRAISRTRRNA